MSFSGAQKIQDSNNERRSGTLYIPWLSFREQNDKKSRSQYLNSRNTKNRRDRQSQYLIDACFPGQEKYSHHNDKIQNGLIPVLCLLQSAGTVFDQREDYVSGNTHRQIADLCLQRLSRAGKDDKKQYRKKSPRKCHGRGGGHHTLISGGLISDAAGNLHRERSRSDAGNHDFVVKLFFRHDLVFLNNLFFYNRNEGGTAPKSYKTDF